VNAGTVPWQCKGPADSATIELIAQLIQFHAMARMAV